MFRSLMAAVLLVLMAPAIAQDISYNFIEGSYQRVELDDGSFDVDGDGFGIGGSVEIGDSFFLFGGLNNTSFDFDVDFDELSIGGGWHTPLTPTVDFVSTLAYVRLDASANGFSVDDDGLGLSAGLRAMVAPKVELAGSVQYIELSDSGNDTSLNGQILYSFTPQFAAGLSIGTGDDVFRYGINARLYFGK